jgi:hypothetical protein
MRAALQGLTDLYAVLSHRKCVSWPQARGTVSTLYAAGNKREPKCTQFRDHKKAPNSGDVNFGYKVLRKK